MVDKRDEKTSKQMEDKAREKQTEKLVKADVGEVAGGAGKQSYDKAPELPEIP